MLLFIVILVIFILIACDAFYDMDETQKKEDAFKKNLNSGQKM